MIREAIDRILELNPDPTFVDKEGVERFTESGKALERQMSPNFYLTTLDSAIEMANGPESDTVKPVTIECSFSGIHVRYSDLYNQKVYRVLICESMPILPATFRFNQKISIEEFRVDAADFFVHDEEFRKLIATISKITEVNETVTTDDGMSTAVEIKNKIGRPENGKVEPFWNLRAHRTFAEVEQPLSQYLLRLSKGHSGPLVSLHEASGAAWKREATEAVYEHIKERVVEGVVVMR